MHKVPCDPASFTAVAGACQASQVYCPCAGAHGVMSLQCCMCRRCAELMVCAQEGCAWHARSGWRSPAPTAFQQPCCSMSSNSGVLWVRLPPLRAKLYEGMCKVLLLEVMGRTRLNSSFARVCQ